MQDLLDQFKAESANYIKELEAVVKGNKAAGARARKIDVRELRPLMKRIKELTLLKA